MLSKKEVDRLQVVQATVEKRMRQWEAAELLGLSVRQVKRLVRRYREEGAADLASRHRGNQPGNTIPQQKR
ncbi:MAG: helix-turn-helix domain-containing protein [Pseudomonadales bacterium]